MADEPMEALQGLGYEGYWPGYFASRSAPLGRILYAGLRSLPIPDEPVARLWHAATPVREHRGDRRNIALFAEGIDGQEAHVFAPLWMGMKPKDYGRISIDAEQLAAAMDGLGVRGLVDAADEFTAAGRETKERIEALTDALAASAYEVLTTDEVDQLTADLEPIAARLTSSDY